MRLICYIAFDFNDSKDLSRLCMSDAVSNFFFLTTLADHITKEGIMAARLKDQEEEQWSQSVPQEGLVKLMKAIENPKKPTEALRRLMRSEDKK